MPCGDVEHNFGPSFQHMLDELLKGQREIKARLGEIETSFKNFEESASAVADVRSIPQNLEEKKVVSLELKLAELEDLSRHNNLLVFGVTEKQTRHWKIFRRLS